MSMIGCLVRVDDETIHALLADPSSIHDFLESAREVDEGSLERSVDLDKAWHGIHFLLTRTAWEGDGVEAFLVIGGEEIGDEDVGYGPARAFSSTEVRALCKALTLITDEELRARFEPHTMTKLDIYPGGWDDAESEQENVRYLVEYFGTMRALVSAAAEAKEGLLVYVG